MSDAHFEPTDSMSSAATAATEAWAAAASALSGTNAALTQFREAISESTAGTNADPSKVHHYLHRNPPAIVSTYEVKVAEKGEAYAQVDTYEREPWGPWRRQVEDVLGGLETAVYATLDWGRTTGTERYGRYRLSFIPSGGRPALVFPHNTALRYGCMVIEEAQREMHREVASWQSRSDVAACKLSSRVTLEREHWPNLLVSGRAYSDHPTHDSLGNVDLVEIVFRDGEIPLTAVAEIRTDEEYSNDLEEAISRTLTDILGSNLSQIDEELLLYLNLASDSSPFGPLYVAHVHNEDEA